jgi:type IV secretion system protein VirB4
MKTISDLSTLVQAYGDFILNDEGALIGGYEFDGVCPDGLDEDDIQAVAGLSYLISLGRPVQMSSLNVHAHFLADPVEPEVFDDPVSTALRKHRAMDMNKRGIYKEKLATFLEMYPRDTPASLFSVNGLKHLFGAFVNQKSRDAVKNMISMERALRFEQSELAWQKEQLEKGLISASRRWRGASRAAPMEPSTLWGWARFLITLDPGCLISNDPMPEDPVAASLASTDIRPTYINNECYIKTGGTSSVYAKVGQVSSLSEKSYTKVFANLPKDNNRVIITRFAPYSEELLKLIFWYRRVQLERKTIKLSDMWRWRQQVEEDLNPSTLRKVLADKFKALEIAEAARFRYGLWHSIVVVFDSDPRKVITYAKDIDSELKDRRLKIGWHDVNMDHAFKTMQPGGKRFSMLDFTASEELASDTVPIHSTQKGDPQIQFLGNAASMILFETLTGVPHDFNPYQKGRFFILGDGPSGAGKTTLRLLLTAALRQYDAISRVVELDPNAVFLADMYGENDAEVFTFDRKKGFNVMASCKGPEDIMFRAHLSSQVSMMMRNGNDSETMKSFTAEEQVDFDNGTSQLLNFFEREEWRLSRIIHDLCPSPGVAHKLARWIHGLEATTSGFYAPLFDSPTEVLREFRSDVAVWDISILQHDEVALPVAMAEIVYRVMREFQDQCRLQILKVLDVEEAHLVLSNEVLVNRLLKPAFLQGRKNKFGVTMWSQNAEHFEGAKWWKSIRDQITMLMFLPNPKLDIALYMRVYQLTKGEALAIKNMDPGQVYLISREAGLSCKVVLNLTALERVITNSNPDEVGFRNEMMKAFSRSHDIESAMIEVDKALEQKRKDEYLRQKRLARR